MEKTEKEEIESDKWFEVFSSGDVWELQKTGCYLFGRRTYDDPSNFDEYELIDNGISDFEEKARIMSLKPFIVVD